MAIFLTGGTGFLGSYVLSELPDERFVLLVRAKDRDHAIEKLWKGVQLHDLDFSELLSRVDFAYGDLHAPGLGLSDGDLAKVKRCDSVLHIAASLNRKSAKACLNTNLRGTLSVIKVAQQMELRRFSHVSTVAVAGHRSNEVVEEDDAIDWNRSDYDPYGRTKKFCEHMARELLPDVPKTFFRPSIVLGDTRHPMTTQFDMMRAVCALADMKVVPFDGNVRVDIVNADFVGKAIARLHTGDAKHDIYHLSAGRQAPTARELGVALGKRIRFVPRLERSFTRTVSALNRWPRRDMVQLTASLLKVFLPYVTYDTVFANERVCDALGEQPASFLDYGRPLYDWCKANRFRYPYRPVPGIRPLPRAEAEVSEARAGRARGERGVGGEICSPPASERSERMPRSGAAK